MRDPDETGNPVALTQPNVFNDSVSSSGSSSGSCSRKDLEAALRGLKDGLVNEEEAAAVVHRLINSELDARFASGQGLEPVIRSVFAHLTEAPTNWHQAVTFFLVSADPQDAQTKYEVPWMFTASWFMVLVQCATAMAVLVSTLTPSCITSDQCPTGTYCQVGFTYRCQYCGSNVPLYGQLDEDGIGTYNNVFDANFRGYNLTLVAEVCQDPWATSCARICPEGSDKFIGDAEGRSCDQICTDRSAGGSMDYFDSPPREKLRLGFDNGGNWLQTYDTPRIHEWCNSCVHGATGDVDSLTQWGLLKSNVRAMGLFDWASLLFSCFIVGFQVVGELKDIELCRLAIAHAPADALSCGWLFGLQALGFFRRWVFLTLLTMIVPLLVVYRGADALNICFNTIAILFMTEIDNVCYGFALGERTRARIEEAGRVELTSKETEGLLWMKMIHVFLVVITCILAVQFAGHSLDYAMETGSGKGSRFITGMSLIPMGYLIGAALSAWKDGLTTNEVLLHVAKACAMRLLSLIIILILIIVSSMWSLVERVIV